MKKYGYITELVKRESVGMFFTTVYREPVERRVEIVGSNNTHYIVRLVGLGVSSVPKRVMKSHVILEESDDPTK